MFMGVTCWLLYIVAGRHFVLTQHLSAFLAAGYQAIATIQEVRTFYCRARLPFLCDECREAWFCIS